MTGITKNELMQMAREAGMDEKIASHIIVATDNPMADFLARFMNAGFERAASECSRIEGVYWHGDGAAAATQCEQSILALKINTGDGNG